MDFCFILRRFSYRFPPGNVWISIWKLFWEVKLVKNEQILYFPTINRPSPSAQAPFKQNQATPMVSGETAIQDKARGYLHQQWISSFWFSAILTVVVKHQNLAWGQQKPRLGQYRQGGGLIQHLHLWKLDKKWEFITFPAPSGQVEEPHHDRGVPHFNIRLRSFDFYIWISHLD